MAAEHPAEREPGEVQTLVPRQHDVEAATTIRASPSAVCGSGGVADSPSPGRSGATTVKARDNGRTLRIQWVHEP